MPKISASPEVRKSIVNRRLPTLITAQKFGRYTLVAKLGRGGMAEVFLGYQAGPRGFRKPIVIKKILSDLAEDPRLVQMFFDEARLAARLHHPNVVQTSDVGEEEGGYFLAMEYLEGQPLSEVIRRSRRVHGAVPPAIAARIVGEALDGLHYAHELKDFDGSPMGVVHRDVSPQNVFITYGGVVKVLDFGVAKAATQVVETRTGAVKGKYAYMAPEQGRGADIDCRADLWAAGVIFWESLAGRRLFKEKTEYATLKAVMEQPIPKLSAGEDALAFQPILDQALCREREERFQDAQQMRNAIIVQLERDFPRVGRTELSKFMKELFSDVLNEHERTLGMAMNAEEGIAHMTAPGKRSAGITSDGLASEVVQKEDLEEDDPQTVPTGAPSHLVESSPGGSVSVLASESKPKKSSMMWVVGFLLCVLLGGLLAVWLPAQTPSNNGENPGLPQIEPETSNDPAAPVVPPTSDLAEEAQQRVAEQEDVRAVPDASQAEPVVEDESAVESAPSPSRLTKRRTTRVRTPRLTMPTTAMANPTTNPAMAEPVQLRGRTGTLRFQTHPWSNVYLGARLLGTTPGSFQIPAGSHVLTLRNPELGIVARYPVQIEAGSVSSRTISIGP